MRELKPETTCLSEWSHLGVCDSRKIFLLEETTLDNYRNLFRMYVIPHIGGRQLYSLDKRVVQDMYKTLVREGGNGKKPLSETTVRTVHRVLITRKVALASEVVIGPFDQRHHLPACVERRWLADLGLGQPLGRGRLSWTGPRRPAW